jgi:periplasmic mercuric ion binding protein
MKFLKSLLGFVLSATLFISCKDTASKPLETKSETTVAKKIVAAVKPETVTFKISGMTCAMGCAKTIEEKLAKMDGVQSAKVDFEKEEAIVNFDLDKLTSNDLTKAVESCADGSTYKVKEIKIGSKS